VSGAGCRTPEINAKGETVLCKEIMKQSVQCAMADDTIQAAARKMRDANVGFLPVCDSSFRVLGTLTDRDLALRVLAENRPLTTKTGDVMTREVVACRPDDDVLRAEQLMAQHHKSRVLCTEADGRLVGVISLSDIAQSEEDRNAAYTMRRVTERETTAQQSGTFERDRGRGVQEMGASPTGHDTPVPPRPQ
jgi:CBS domain-containing protein